jgi:hypothetical protein
MLSIKSGNHIANVLKGKRVVKSIYLNDLTNDDKETTDNDNNKDELMPRSFYTTLRGITPANMIILKRAIRLNNNEIIPKHNTAMIDAFKQAQIILKEVNNKTIIIKPDDGIIQFVPVDKHFAIAVYGPSGVGKSTWVANLMLEYKKKYKKDCDIYVFSSIKDDVAFAKAEPTYIKIDDSILTDPFNIAEFGLNKHNLVIFDDVESLNDSHYKAISKFRSSTLECGRHENIDIIAIHHVILGGNDTKKIINECDYSVVFPRCNFSSIEKLCKNYYGFGRDDLSYLKELGKRSRFAIIKRSYPSCIISEHEVKIV